MVKSVIIRHTKKLGAKMKSANTLFAKVAVKRSPYGNDAVSVRIVADVFPDAPVTRARFFAELPLAAITLSEIESRVESMRAQANAQDVRLGIHPKVLDLLPEAIG